MIIFSLSIIIELNVKVKANFRSIFSESNQINCPEFSKSSVKFFVLYVQHKFPFVFSKSSQFLQD